MKLFMSYMFMFKFYDSIADFQIPGHRGHNIVISKIF